MIKEIKHHYDVISLISALILLLAALTQPSIKVERGTQSYIFFIDVTQSMNVQDMQLEGKSVSRLEYTKQLLKETVKGLPCNARVGLGIFFKATAALLYAPIETCSNYNVLLDTIDHLDWRMASHGSSNIRLGLQSIASTLLTSGEAAQVTFITDGQEAAPLNVINKTSLSGWQGGDGWLLVGVGGNRPMPIPKYNAKNEVVGYWSIYSLKIEPSAIVSEESTGTRDDSIATEPYEYYLSNLDETYMKELAKEINAQYLRAGKPEDLLKAMHNQKPALHYISKFELNQILALSALLFMISGYLPNAITKVNKFRKNRKIN